MGTADRTRQYLSAYRSAVVVGAIGVALTVTAGVTEDNSPPKPPRVVGDGHPVTPPPVTVTATVTPPAPIGAPTQTRPTASVGPSLLPTPSPSTVPIPPPSTTPAPSATPTPTPTLTPRNKARGLKPPWCIVVVDHHGQVIKRPCKESP